MTQLVLVTLKPFCFLSLLDTALLWFCGVVFCGNCPKLFCHSFIVPMYSSCKVVRFLIRCYIVWLFFLLILFLVFWKYLPVSLGFPLKVAFCKQYLLCLRGLILIWFCVSKGPCYYPLYVWIFWVHVFLIKKIFMKKWASKTQKP